MRQDKGQTRQGDSEFSKLQRSGIENSRIEAVLKETHEICMAQLKIVHDLGLAVPMPREFPPAAEFGSQFLDQPLLHLLDYARLTLDLESNVSAIRSTIEDARSDIYLVKEFLQKLDRDSDASMKANESRFLISATVISKSIEIQSGITKICQELTNCAPKPPEENTYEKVADIQRNLDAPSSIQHEIPKKAQALKAGIAVALDLMEESTAPDADVAAIVFATPPRKEKTQITTKTRGVSSGTAVVLDNTNGELELKMALAKCRVPVSVDGTSIPLDSWVEAAAQLDPSLQVMRERTEIPIQAIDRFGHPSAGEADLIVSFSSPGPQVITIPHGYRIVGQQFRSAWNFKVQSASCIEKDVAGVHYIVVPPRAKQLQIRIAPREEAGDITEELYSKLIEVNTAFTMESPPLVGEQVKKAQDSDLVSLNPEEREALVMNIAHAFKIQKPVYSQSEKLKTILETTGSEFSNFLNGLNCGTCETLSWQVCMQLRLAGFPAFLVGGKILEEQNYMTDPGHEQVLVFCPHAIILDPTTWTEKKLIFDDSTLLDSQVEVLCNRVSLSESYSVGREMYREFTGPRLKPTSGHHLQDNLSDSPSEELKLREWEISVSEALVAVAQQAEATRSLSKFSNAIRVLTESIKAFVNDDIKPKKITTENEEKKVSGNIGEMVYEMATSLLNSREYPVGQRSEAALNLFNALGTHAATKKPNLMRPFFEAALDPDLVSKPEQNQFIRFPRAVLTHTNCSVADIDHSLQAITTLVEGSALSARSISAENATRIRNIVVEDIYKFYCSVYGETQIRDCPPVIHRARERIGMALQKVLSGEQAEMPQLLTRLIEVSSEAELKDDPGVLNSFLKQGGQEKTLENYLHPDARAEIVRILVATAPLVQLSESVIKVEKFLGAQLDLTPHRELIESRLEIFVAKSQRSALPLPTGNNRFSRWVFQNEERTSSRSEACVVSLHRRGGLGTGALQEYLREEASDATAFRHFVEDLGGVNLNSKGQLEIGSRYGGISTRFSIESGVLLIASLAPEQFTTIEGGQKLVYLANTLKGLGDFDKRSDYESFKAWSVQYPDTFHSFAQHVAGSIHLGDYAEEGLLHCVGEAIPDYEDRSYLYSVAVSEHFLSTEGGKNPKEALNSHKVRIASIDGFLGSGDFGAFEEAVKELVSSSSYRQKDDSNLQGLFYLFDRKQQETVRLYSVINSATRPYWTTVESPPYSLSSRAKPIDEVWYRVLMDMHYFRRHEFSDAQVRDQLKEVRLTLPSGSKRSSKNYVTDLDGGSIRHSGWTDNFIGSRSYNPGDDLRLLDYKALARLDKLYVKQFGSKPPSEEGIEAVVILSDGDAMVSSPRVPNSQVRRAVQYSLLAERENKSLQVLGFFRGAAVWSKQEQELKADASVDKPAGFELLKQLWTHGYDVGTSYCQAWGRSHPLTPLFNELPTDMARALTDRSGKSTLFVFACSPTVMAATIDRFPDLKSLNIAHMRNFETVHLDDVIMQ